MSLLRYDAESDAGHDDLHPLDPPDPLRGRVRFLIPGAAEPRRRPPADGGHGRDVGPAGVTRSLEQARRPADRANAPISAAQQGSRLSAPHRVVNFTEEQQGAIDDDADVVVVKALAGTGKTTSSVGFTAARPNERTLYLCFNKAIADEAATRLPKHVTVRTTHSVAWAALDSRMRARVARSWKVVDVMQELQRLTGRQPPWTDAGIIMRMMQDFFADTTNLVDADLHSARALARYPDVKPVTLEACAELANILWSDMRSAQGTTRFPHDAYLKLFVLRRPNLGYDRVIFEEAQDGNPLTNALVNLQRDYGSKLLILGDEHQSIYEFRGAFNAFSDLPDGASIHTLTNTWRFGPRTAAIANAILAAFKPSEAARIKGLGKDAPWDDAAPVVHLARTNAQLFELAVDHVQISTGPIYWVGGIKKYRINQLEDAYALWEGRYREVKDEFLRRFQTWDALTDYGEKTDDPDARILAELVERYNHDIPELVAKINRRQAADVAHAAIGLGTAHSAKGLEFNQVQLCDDFDRSFERTLAAYEQEQFGIPEEQEINLLYVTVTRAMRHVRLNPALQTWLGERAQADSARHAAGQAANQAASEADPRSSHMRQR